MGFKSALKRVAQKSSKSPRKKGILSPSQSPHENDKIPSNQPLHMTSVYQGKKTFSQEGNLNFRVLAFAGGISVILTSALTIGICISHFDLLDMMIYMYSLSFGLLICILEGQFIKSDRLNHVRQVAIEGLPVLKYLWGRGVLYVLSGSLQLSHLDSMNFLSGVFLICVGILFVFIGMNSRRRLKRLKAVLKDEKVLKRQFRRFDRDGDNFLDFDEFGDFVANLTGEDMDEDELEGAFGSIDSSGKGYITLEELQAWFTGFKEAEETEEAGGTNNTFQML